jgi:hypothetical protein
MVLHNCNISYHFLESNNIQQLFPIYYNYSKVDLLYKFNVTSKLYQNQLTLNHLHAYE